MALAEVSFDVRACEVLGLIDPNEASIAGVLPAHDGSSRWRGTAVVVRAWDVMFYR